MNSMITIAKNSNDIDFIKYAFSLGVKDFRINMDYEKDAYDAISKLKTLYTNYEINIYADFQGDKFRIQLKDGENDLQYKIGEQLQFYYENNYPFISHVITSQDKIKVDQILSIADGKIIAEITTVDSKSFTVTFTKVDYVLRNNAGCCFLGERAPFNSMTKDSCLKIAKSLAVENKMINWVILSFVDSPDEISDFIKTMHERNIKVMAKIETKNGVLNIEKIAPIIDGFMIGRGDLKNTSQAEYQTLYETALDKLKNLNGNGFYGVGTFFLSKFSETKVLTDDEKLDVLKIKELRLDYIMLSKEVVNSKYPRESIKKMMEL